MRLQTDGRRHLLVVMATTSLAITAGCARSARPQETGFLHRTVEVGGEQAEYVVYVPSDYASRDDWPVILFLHGAGERGDGGLVQSDVGLGRAIRQNPERWPAVVVFPQVPEGDRWVGRMGGVAMAALDATVAELAIDESRTYLTGLSMGGQGSWYLAYEHTDRWAAVLPICGFLGFEGTEWGPFTPEGADPVAATSERIAGLSIWVFHGDADGVVPVEASREVVAALESRGADVTYTELPGVGHDSWDAAYADEVMIEWLFRQVRPARPGRQP
jgi:predicted peptidase